MLAFEKCPLEFARLHNAELTENGDGYFTEICHFFNPSDSYV